MTALASVGLNHQTASVEIRGRLAFAAPILPDALESLANEAGVREAVILSTCNRTEIYAVADSAVLQSWWAHFHHLPEKDIAPYLYHLQHEEVVRHVFRVACGLDSMVLGEPQILGQMKDAVRAAQQKKTIKSTLNMLFQRTFAVAKAVRSQTAVGAQSVSMAAASVKLAEQIFPHIADLHILFIGAGEMIELVATYFAAHHPKRITIVNRTLSRAQDLATRLQGNVEALALTELPQILHQYDVVVASTASPFPIVGKGLMEEAIKKRRHKPMFLLDLAVPADIEPQVSDIADAFLYTVDDMTQIVNSGKASRQKAAHSAEQMIHRHVHDFSAWQASRRTIPLICHLRENAQADRLYVLHQAKRHLASGMPPEEVLERLSVQLTNKLLHAPIKALSPHEASDSRLIESITKIYHLHD